jgi:hypothetical protein
MFLAVERDAELFDELQLRFQKIDVLFLIDEQLVIELLGDEVVGGDAIFRCLGVERSRGNLSRGSPACLGRHETGAGLALASRP